MHPLMNKLVQDHVNLSKMHKCLRNEISLFTGSEERPSIAIILDALDYLKNYPEMFHHPLEDKVYGLMRLRISNPGLLAVLDQIEMQHAQMQILSKRLQDDFLAIANDQIVPMARVVSDFEKYIELAEEHIACENHYLFPAITEYLSSLDMDGVLRAYQHHQDPLFSDLNFALYQDLHAYVLEQECA